MTLRLILFLLSVILLICIIFQKKIRRWKKAGLVLLSLILVLFTGFRYIIPVKSPPAPTGSLTVVTDTMFFRYPSDIPEMLTHGSEREISVKVWYPQNLQKKQHPLLLYSPGSFGTAEANETMFLELASRGYIVLSLNHPYHSFISETSDGKSIFMDFDFIKSVANSQGSEDLPGTLKLFDEWLAVRIDDINIVLEKILDYNVDNDYTQYIDTERIVLSGHSLGGSAVLAVGREKSENIRAMVILEAPFAKDIIGIDGDEYIFTDEDYPLPVLHVYSDNLFDKIDEITTYGMNARLLNSSNPMYVNKHIEGVGHLGLTDMALLSPIITNLIDSGADKRQAPETLLELNGYVIEFLDNYNK
jgi:hypothetical protein